MGRDRIGTFMQLGTPSSPDARHHRAVRLWLYALAALVAAMVLVGGMTRLTDSGLSITEWRPVTGTIPPLSAADWAGEFAKYRQTPQYQTLNSGMELAGFKSIYWWEWAHRFLGRMVGVVFAVPFLYFLVRKQLPRQILPGLVVVFLLGALQGAIGWWMVASGLVNRTSVAPYRLAVHLTLAFLIFSCLLWVARSLRPAPREPTIAASVRFGAWALLVLSFVQVALGALVAGLDAGRGFNTWPLIDGGLVPNTDSLFAMRPLWANVFENPLTAQFDHRMGAYLLLAVAVWHAVDSRRTGGGVSRLAYTILGIVLVQAGVGIATLLYGAPPGLSLVHQLLALGVVAHAAMHAHQVGFGARSAAVPTQLGLVKA